METYAKPQSNTYAESLGYLLSGQIVEIYLGETYEQIKMEQSDENNPAILVGKILEGHGNVLVVEAAAFRNRRIDHYRKVYINDYSIKFICVLEPSNVGATNIFMDSREAGRIYNEIK